VFAKKYFEKGDFLLQYQGEYLSLCYFVQSLYFILFAIFILKTFFQEKLYHPQNL